MLKLQLAFALLILCLNQAAPEAMGPGRWKPFSAAGVDMSLYLPTGYEGREAKLQAAVVAIGRTDPDRLKSFRSWAEKRRVPIVAIPPMDNDALKTFVDGPLTEILQQMGVDNRLGIAVVESPASYEAVLANPKRWVGLVAINQSKLPQGPAMEHLGLAVYASAKNPDIDMESLLDGVKAAERERFVAKEYDIDAVDNVAVANMNWLLDHCLFTGYLTHPDLTAKDRIALGSRVKAHIVDVMDEEDHFTRRDDLRQVVYLPIEEYAKLEDVMDAWMEDEWYVIDFEKDPFVYLDNMGSLLDGPWSSRIPAKQKATLRQAITKARIQGDLNRNMQLFTFFREAQERELRAGGDPNKLAEVAEEYAAIVDTKWSKNRWVTQAGLRLKALAPFLPEDFEATTSATAAGLPHAYEPGAVHPGS